LHSTSLRLPFSLYTSPALGRISCTAPGRSIRGVQLANTKVVELIRQYKARQLKCNCGHRLAVSSSELNGDLSAAFSGPSVVRCPHTHTLVIVLLMPHTEADQCV
jgi:hypothetical protein